jgi:2-keto-4-pentenoate hydratase/2-oxohepta-3-ene-1,7-dioic acid hydratase in catechol pathway
MLGLIDAGRSGLAALRACLDEVGTDFPIHTATALANVRLLAPIPRPRKNIFGIGLNYLDHVIESAKALDTNKDLPKQPVIFSKPPTAVIGPDEPILHNAKITKQLDWEVELAVIIGTRAKYVTEAQALNHVAGYAVTNDVSERAFQIERSGQWTKGKSCDNFGQIGPWLVTRDEVADPQDMPMWLTVNGKTYQNGSTKTMVYGVAHLVSYLSQFMTLHPGDVISTGTPPGVGLGQKPPHYLKAGDVVELGIQGLGQQRQDVIADPE